MQDCEFEDVFITLSKCADDTEQLTYLQKLSPSIRARVEQLLDAHSRQGILDTPVSNASDICELLTNADSQESPGKLGEYDIVRILGCGGMGTVFLAVEPRLDRQVAIKVINSFAAFDDRAQKRLIREAQAAARIQSPHVVEIFRIEDAQKPPHIVMEYIAGSSLATMISSAPSMAVEDVIRISCDIAEGLAAAHEKGVVHGDVKPENILVDKNGSVKIVDFGLARVADSRLSFSREIHGTPLYMSPEQVRGEELDARSDLFSLGSVMYTMCTGKPAFQSPEAASPLAVMKRVCERRPIPVRRQSPAVPRSLAMVIERLMNKSPRGRYQTAKEVAHELRRIQRGHWSLRNVARSLFQDRRIVWSAIGTACLAILTVAIWLASSHATTNQADAILKNPHTEEDVAISAQPKSGYVPSNYHPLAPAHIEFPLGLNREEPLQLMFEARPGKYSFRITDEDNFIADGKVVTLWYLSGDKEHLERSKQLGGPRAHTFSKEGEPQEAVLQLPPGTTRFMATTRRWREGEVWSAETKEKDLARTVCTFYSYADLSYENARLNKTVYSAPDWIELSLDVVNCGNVAAKPGCVRICFHREKTVTGTLEEIDYPALEPGERQPISYRYSLPGRLQLGIHYVSVQVDANNSTVERDELPIGSWKAHEGRAFVVAIDEKGPPPLNNICMFPIRVDANAAP